MCLIRAGQYLRSRIVSIFQKTQHCFQISLQFLLYYTKKSTFHAQILCYSGTKGLLALTYCSPTVHVVGKTLVLNLQ